MIRGFLRIMILGCLFGTVLLTAGCSIIAYRNMEPENPYKDLPRKVREIAVG
jgi:predicted ATPase